VTAPLPPGWEAQVLEGIGAPVTPQNVQNLDVWQRAEGGSTANPDNYNPFDTTLPAPGSFGTNSVGVQAYPDWSTGLAATVKTLEMGYYTNIVGDLRSGAPYGQFAGDVNASPWDSHLPGAVGGSPSSGGGGGGSSLWGDAAGVVGGLANPAGVITQGIGALSPGNLITDAVKGLVSSGLVMRGTLIVVGLIILFIGLSQLTKSDDIPGTLQSGSESLQVTVRQASKRAQKRAGRSGGPPAPRGRVGGAREAAAEAPEEAAAA
jgi:hypothetical protein